MTQFKNILKKIESGEILNQKELLPFLTLGSREERANINLVVANSLFNSPEIKNKRFAIAFAERAWELSRFADSFFDFYYVLLEITRNSAKAREALKIMGLAKAAEGDIVSAINFFNRWQYVFPRFELIDFYEYDYTILNAVANLAKSFGIDYSFSDHGDSSIKDSGKKKLAFIVPGVTQINNVVTKENHYIFEHIDKSKFEIAAVIIEREKEVYESKQGQRHIEKFKKNGAKIFIAGNGENYIRDLIELGKTVVDFKPDLIVASEILSDFYYYFFFRLIPQEIKSVGLSYSLPALSISPSFSHAIVSMRHPLMETPVNATLIDMEIELPKKENISAVKKSDLGIPENSVVLVSAGRYNKFQNDNYWQIIEKLLSENENLYFVIIGPSRELLPKLNLLNQNIAQKIIPTGWVEQPYDFLALGDVYIDSFPQGGGLTLKEALALEIPVVSFEQDFLRRYDPREVSIASEFMSRKEWIIRRGDFQKFYEAVNSLVNNKDLRMEIGREERKRIMNISGNPKRMVKKYEEVFCKVIDE